jgi:FdhD protein
MSAGALHRRIVRDGERDVVAIEEPLEIRVDGEPLAVTMRTPGHDEELAAGFLYGEGLLAGVPEVSLTDDLAANTVEVKGPLARDPGVRRFYTTSSCGVCGKGALEQVAVDSPPLGDGPRVARSLLASLPDRLIQPGFERTGGLHATGLFDAGGELLCVREDVGRHNAMDKVVGWALRNGRVPLRDDLLCVSGRLSFELVQKAAVAGAPILVGVGAPTSLAVELAADRALTLCGFARRGQVNVYTHPERALDDGAATTPPGARGSAADGEAAAESTSTTGATANRVA